MDLINIVMIGLAKELPEQDPEYELHRLLCTLFLPEIPQEERITILENEYDIPVKLVGLGEGIDDIAPFDAKEFVDGILDTDDAEETDTANAIE